MISSRSSKMILVADDEVHLNDGLRYSLEKEGYRVITAYDGQEAVKKARKYLPDLVLLDVMMPIMDGWQACTTIRADDRTRSIPIIFLSARGRPEDMLRGFALGANDYIAKPFQLELLFARIEAVLRTIETEKPGDRKTRSTVRSRIKTVFDPYRLAGNLFSDKYRLTEYAGGGGMGAVYRALE